MMYVKIMLRLDFHLLGLSVSVRTMLTCGHLRPWLNIHRVEKNSRQRSARQARFSPLGSYTHCVCLRVRSPGGRRASGGSDSIAASLSVKEKNVWLCLFCLVFRGRHHASGLLLFFSSPLSRTHTHPTLACDHRSINRISLTFLLIEWRVEVILGLTRIFSPSRNICSTYRRSAAVWDSSEAAGRGRLACFFPMLSNVSASTKLCREAVRNGRTAAVTRDAQTDVRVRLSHASLRLMHVFVRRFNTSVESVNSTTSAKAEAELMSAVSLAL